MGSFRTKENVVATFSAKVLFQSCKQYGHVVDTFIPIKRSKNGRRFAVYAAHDCRDKQMLWDYLTYEIGKWKWEVVIMGDFNEVRYKSDKFGSVFNVQGANVFNSFITNADLKEVPLGGSAFT
ncbi:RNA-directed DNA polymerase, eukaryota, partial [Tanacetum coccineum]